MSNFSIQRCSVLPQEKIFDISIDVENFHKIMPNHFKSLDIIEENKYGMIVNEKINFLGMNLNVKTKHVIIYPNIHEVHILSGPTKGTSFIESYDSSGNGTVITINVNLKFNGILKYFPFLHGILAQKMSKTMDVFIRSAEASSRKEIPQR